MSSLSFIKTLKRNLKRPEYRGIPSVSFTRPAVADQVDPIEKLTKPVEEVKTRASMEVGRIAIIVGGPKAGSRACIVSVSPRGLVKVAGPNVPLMEISQDYLISTETKINVPEGATESQVQGACDKELLEYLKAEFKIGKHDKVHSMKF